MRTTFDDRDAAALRHEEHRARAEADALHRERERLAVQQRPRRRRWPGLLAAGLIGAAVGALLTSNLYDDRTIGQRLDAAVDATGERLRSGGAELREDAAQAARSGALATDRAAERSAGAVGDARITGAVKGALATDPALSALRIDVTTENGVVRLEGPAPDVEARERASVLASAPDGVVGVDNRLTVGETGR